MNAKRKQVETVKPKEKKEINNQNENLLSKKESKTSQHIGHHFRKVRERKHYSLEEISKVLRIGERYLEAIEEGNIEILPERVYTLGFVRAYAQYLGEKPTKCVEQFKQQTLLENQAVQLNLPDALRKSTTPNKMYLLISIGVAITVLLLLFLVKSFSQEKQEIPDLIPSEKTLSRLETNDSAQIKFHNSATKNLDERDSSNSLSIMSPTQEASIKVNESTPSSDGEKQLEDLKDSKTLNQSSDKNAVLENNLQITSTHIKLTCIEETWVQIKDAQGNIILVKTMLPGESYEVPQKEGLILLTGNAGGLNITVGNAPSKSLGAKGEVKDNILLDDESLLSYLKAH